MILVDTAIWIDHFRSEDILLRHLLEREEVMIHPWTIGEIALGSLADRQSKIAALQHLPRARVAVDDEMLGFIERHKLHVSGIGYVDTHLLASCLLHQGVKIWTRDKRLLVAARRLSRDAKLMH